MCVPLIAHTCLQRFGFIDSVMLHCLFSCILDRLHHTLYHTWQVSSGLTLLHFVQQVRQLFVNPEVIHADEMPALVWKAPDEEALVQWLVHEKQFSEERVRSAVAKMVAAKGKATQNRLESFFKVSVGIVHCRLVHVCSA
jgi:hypothetical protein